MVFYRIAIMSKDGAWAREIDRMQRRDRIRVDRYLAASARYLDEFWPARDATLDGVGESVERP